MSTNSEPQTFENDSTNRLPETFENDSTYDPEEMDKLLADLEDMKYSRFAEELEKLVYMNKNDKSVWNKLPLTPYDRVDILFNLLKEEQDPKLSDLKIE